MAKAFPLLSSDPEGSFAQNAGLMLHIRLGEMYRLSSAVPDIDRVDDLHAMRIAAKRLRYTLEIFAPCFEGEEATAEFKYILGTIKSIQEQIGDIHDCDVRLPAIIAFLGEHGRRRPEIKVGLERLIEREQILRERLYCDLVAYWAKIERAGFRLRFEKAILGLGMPATSSFESSQPEPGV